MHRLSRPNGRIIRFWKTLKVLSKDRLFFFGLAVVVVMVFIAVLAPWLTPYSDQGAGFAASPPPTLPRGRH